MKRKYDYFRVIQQNYGNGWEDNSHYETNSSFVFADKAARDLFKHDLKEYRFTGYPTRTINRREPKGQ